MFVLFNFKRLLSKHIVNKQVQRKQIVSTGKYCKLIVQEYTHNHDLH